MKVHLEAQGERVWDVVQNGSFIPTSVINGVRMIKIQISWDEDDKKKSSTTRKQLTYFKVHLAWMNCFVSISALMKNIWHTLVETHEGTAKVNRSRLNTLSQEYKLFRMQPGESFIALQKRFVHLTNHLMVLGKTFTNDEINLKVLRSLTRECKPKVVVIFENNSLSNMSSTMLFRKLQEHEIELGRLEKYETQ